MTITFSLWKNRELRYVHFCGFSGAKIVILSPIDFLFGLPINLNANDGQNKFEVNILKNVTNIARIADFRPTIG